MRVIHLDVRLAPVRGALNHDDHGNCLRLLKFFIIFYFLFFQEQEKAGLLSDLMPSHFRQAYRTFLSL